MQNSPSHVQIWTHANWRMVRGIWRMAARISATGEEAARSAGWSEASGGYSRVVEMVHRTAARKTAAPSVNESLTAPGMAWPAAAVFATPAWASSHGNAEAITAP